MKYRVEKRRDDGTWRVYRAGQLFRTPNAARRLMNRLMDRYGEDRVRLTPISISAADDIADTLRVDIRSNPLS